ncbi:hypothetical protein ACOQFV_26370 [Nocardiopsis changdeensis]|uniref:Uncharacterized protein n=1 Tax=Nocardiopsis changdeensis TaxID=2831969 RepID=A0ABX8BF15_9ACTN|nr:MULTISPECIES: hypothetical protein [Nocardiopsis]QUX20622.1 hypothetical protein KGD84_19165 [Nocardiopsis changdeensis]QYX36553.1 hypothetical protein K1J57_28620 [Nocardiopsis sp. MT53]
MWLWQDVDHFTFNVGERLSGTVDYRDDGQFAPVAEDLALLARERIVELRCRFVDLESVERHMAGRPVGRGLLWEAWNAGVVAALAGDTAAARKRFAAVLEEDPVVPWMDGAQRAARELLDMVHDQGAVRAWVRERISSCRQRLSLESSEPAQGVFAGLL